MHLNQGDFIWRFDATFNSSQGHAVGLAVAEGSGPFPQQTKSHLGLVVMMFLTFMARLVSHRVRVAMQVFVLRLPAGVEEALED